MLKFALKNMAIKKVQIVLIVLSIVLSAGIGVLAFNVATQVDEGITSGAQYYSAIIGPAGSNTQLAMNTMYFNESPVGTIPYSVVSMLQQDQRVKTVIPFAMADNYNGYGVVGTTPEYLKNRTVCLPMEGSTGWWGSFIDCQGNFNRLRAAEFERLGGFSMPNLHCRCSVAALQQHLTAELAQS